MARPKRTEKTVRLNLDLTPDARDSLERLRVQCKADSLSEVIRRALAALERLADHEGKGGEVILRTPDAREIRLLVI